MTRQFTFLLVVIKFCARETRPRSASFRFACGEDMSRRVRSMQPFFQTILIYLHRALLRHVFSTVFWSCYCLIIDITWYRYYIIQWRYLYRLVGVHTVLHANFQCQFARSIQRYVPTYFSLKPTISRRSVDFVRYQSSNTTISRIFRATQEKKKTGFVRLKSHPGFWNVLV